MRTVYKYEFDPMAATLELDLPEGAKVVHVGTQNVRGPELCMWVEVDTEVSVLVHRSFKVVGTGYEVPFGGTHVGTAFSDPQGSFVWHVYERL